MTSIETNTDSRYVKRGLLGAAIILFIALTVFYDDVYSDGMHTTFKSKVKRLFKSDSPPQQEEDVKETKVVVDTISR